ncbi:MAG: hypothetical protein KDA47_19410, partial [Planctomycetales bacterium]|nr:hypothetical protein [Planctomycetales bacterium]
ADWPEPAAVLFITERQDRYIEPCGCTGLANQKGGLARRFTFLKQLRDEKQWPVVAVDAGNQVRRFGVQPVFKFQRTVDALKQMKYDAAAFGRDDLRLPAGELFAVVADQNQDGNTPFISANVALLDESFTPRYRVVEAGGQKIGITTILGDEFVSQIKSDEVPTASVADGLNIVWPKLEAEDCDLYLLLAHASLEESAAIARQFPKFDFVVTAGGLGEPTHEPEPISNLPDGSTTKMIQVGTKGMYVGVLGLFPDASDKFRYQRVPLTDRYDDAPEMRRLMKGYQDQLEAVGLAGLEVKPIPHPSGNRYVGSESCGACHEDAYDVWKDSAHSHALDSLVHPGERSDIARHYDPECLSCHVTGWNPQKYYPYTSGYLSLEETPRMAHSGCENCHGPGSAHVAAETGDEDVSEMEILARRAAMVLKLEDAERRCMDCHDLDNSPDFHDEGAFQKYWDQIAH